MKRILVTGNAGSGKTTLSRQLAKQLQLPLHGLDNIVWKPGWKKTPDHEKREKIQNLIQNESWIIDGVSKQVFDAADTIYFLDLPVHKCIFNILRRFASNGLKTRDTLPENCPEYIGVFKAIRIAFLYRKQTRPFILEMIESQKSKNIIWMKKYH